jgi:hypothetical protein
MEFLECLIGGHIREGKETRAIFEAAGTALRDFCLLFLQLRNSNSGITNLRIVITLNFPLIEASEASEA